MSEPNPQAAPVKQEDFRWTCQLCNHNFLVAPRKEVSEDLNPQYKCVRCPDCGWKYYLKVTLVDGEYKVMRNPKWEQDQNWTMIAMENLMWPIAVFIILMVLVWALSMFYR